MANDEANAIKAVTGTIPSNWESLDLASVIGPTVPNAIIAFTDIINKYLTLAKGALALAKTYQALLSGSGPDILGVLIKALTDTLRGLLQAGKAHVLFVPIPKRFPNAAKSTSIGTSITDAALEMGMDVAQAAKIIGSGANTAYSGLTKATGGNGAFYRSFVASLNDAFDDNRPQYFSHTDAVVMAVLLAGAPTFAGLIDIAAAFNRLFRPKGNSDLTSRMIPVPQGLRAKVIGLPTASRIGVRLDWNVPQAVYDSPYFPAVSTRVVKYAVIRSTDPKIASSAHNVYDFFSTNDLQKGLTSDDAAKASQVIATGTGSNSTYIDNDKALDRNHSYYYCVAWQVEIVENKTAVLYGYDRVSNVVKTRVRVVPTGVSTPPDWTASKNLLSVVPEFGEQVEILIAQISALGERQTGGASGGISAGIELLEKNLDQFLVRVDALNARVKRFAAMTAHPLPAFFETTMVGVGGNAFLMSELATRLNDTSDPNRPPYDDNEYVMGVCIVGGGPRVPDIQPIIDFIDLLFKPPGPTNPLVTGLDAVNAIAAAQEQFYFTPGCEAYPVNPDGTVQLPEGTPLPDGTAAPAGGVAVDPAVLDPLTGLPKVTTQPVIADSGIPVAALDPASPYTGDP